MKPVHVVTSFLLRRDAGKEKVLLLRRSDRVGSFPRRWAGVSGYIEEAPPLGQAMTEIREETGLIESDVVLLNQGRSVRTPDPGSDCIWVVHPFLYLVVWPDRVRLDWEHTESRWIKPSSLDRFDTVPNLRSALEQVYPPPVFPGVLDFLLQAGRDRHSGASELADAARETVERSACEHRAGPAELSANLVGSARAIGRVRPSMTAMANAMARLVEELSGSTRRDGARIVQAARKGRTREAGARHDASARLNAHAERLLHGTVVTLSYSSTVAAALVHCRERVHRVVVGEGRPGFEGRKMAERLAAQGIDVTLVTDAGAASSIARADSVAVGADTITATGDVVNKAGTYPLALAAKDQKKPLYVLADTLKISPHRKPPHLEVMPPGELWPGAPDGVTPDNRYFDVTPARLATAYVTEDGVVDRRWIAEKARTFRRARKLLGI